MKSPDTDGPGVVQATEVRESLGVELPPQIQAELFCLILGQSRILPKGHGPKDRIPGRRRFWPPETRDLLVPSCFHWVAMDDEGDVSSESSTGGESPPHIGFDVSVPGRSNRTGGIASIALDGSVPTLDEIVDVKLVERGRGDVKVDLWDSLTPIEG